MATSTENCEKKVNSTIRNDIIDYSIIKFNPEADYSVNLVRNLYKQYKNNLFCDVDLIANDGVRFSVHQNVLTASSCYFNAMFSSGMKENATKEIPLKDANGEILRLLIDFCYSEKIEITSDKIQALLAIASRYEFVEIEKQCSKFLEQFLKTNPLNCLAYYSLAYLYNFDGLKKLSKQLVCEYFMKLKDTEEFLLLKFDQLFEVIKCDELIVLREEDVYNAVMTWIEHDKANREKFAIDLFKVIRFTQMEATFLVNEVVKPTTTPELEQIFKDVLNFKFELKPVSLEGFPLNPRKNMIREENSDIEIFAFLQLNNSPLLHREIYSVKDQCWKILATFSLPTKEAIHTFVRWRNLLFLCWDEGRIIGFDMNSFVITKSTKIPTPRSEYAITVWNDCIYVIGGMQIVANDEYEYEDTRSIKKYDIEEGVWSWCGSLRDDKSVAIATIVNDTIYCAGCDEEGIECIELNKIMETSGNKMIETLDNVRSLFSHNKQLYAEIGGIIQRYDSATEEWTEICNDDSIQPSYRSNQLFRVDRRSGFNIEKYYAGKEWINYGQLAGEYPPGSELFLLDNKM